MSLSISDDLDSNFRNPKFSMKVSAKNDKNKKDEWRNRNQKDNGSDNRVRKRDDEPYLGLRFWPRKLLAMVRDGEERGSTIKK